MHDHADPLKDDDRRLALTTLRDILADHLRQADSNVAAQIAARYQAVLAEIAALPETKPRDLVDELKEKRQKRRAS